MKFIIKDNLKENIAVLMRRLRYHFQRKDEEKKEWVFIRPLGGGPYPRFHIYLKIDSEDKELIFNLHLDQKQPIYRGAPAHSAEYNDEIITTEAQRIMDLIKSIK